MLQDTGLNLNLLRGYELVERVAVAKVAHHAVPK